MERLVLVQLGLAQERLLGRLALRVVLDHRDAEAGAAIGPADDRQRGADPDRRAVGALQAGVDAQRGPLAGEQLPDRRDHAVARFRVEVLGEVRRHLVGALESEHADHRGVGVDDVAVGAHHHHAGERAVVDRVKPGDGLGLPAPSLELGRAAHALGQHAGQQLQRLAVLLAEPLLLGGAHDAQRADGTVAGEERDADVRAIAHLRADLGVEPWVVFGVLDQQRCAGCDGEPRHALVQRPAGVQEPRGDPVRRAGDDLIALDQADH